ncbi:MAG: hypothetical protein FWF44_11450 [Defluviitaleaceae bacterium]|nr:hypothetical protein [Defluviitaleaceae bacterium]
MKRILRDKSGVSLMFVLAAMLLLMAIGVSAITAAGLNYGAGLARRDWNQLELYSTGMEHTLKAALEAPDSDTSMLGAQTLSGRLLRAAFQSGSAIYSIGGDGAITMTAASPDGNARYTIVITGYMNVQIIAPVDETELVDVYGPDPENPDGAPIVVDYKVVKIDRSAQAALFSGEFTVKLTTEYLAGNKAMDMTTTTTYRYLNGHMEERDYDFNAAPDDSNMYIDNWGAWTVIGHE